MTGQPYRLASGGLIDRSRPVSFSFNGSEMQGLHGDTVASALLANGVKIVARSFKYHRPRGIYAAGVEEPGALLTIRRDGVAEPNARASQVPLEEGMQVRSQNHWPSLGFDILRVNDLLSPVFSAGFYNKTFKWPRRFWPLYERVLRNIAGLGRAPSERDARDFEQRFHHCDVLIVGGGPAGLSAALALTGQSLRVLLVDENAEPGGWLLRERCTVNGRDGRQWAAEARAMLETSANVELMTSTTAFGYYDHNLVALCEQRPGSSERMWRVRAAEVILATGAIERPLVFPNNDLPGVMLAGAARAWVNQYAVMPGERAVVHTNNDSAYRTAADLADAGVRVLAIVDTRPEPGERARAVAATRSIPLYTDGRLQAFGRRVLRFVRLRHAGASASARIDCDLLCVSGGWTPTIHLHAQSGGTSVYRETLDAFVPDAAKQPCVHAGAVTGLHGIRDCLADGQRAARDLVRRAGGGIADADTPVDATLDVDAVPEGVPRGARYEAGGKQFVDLQNDVTTKDVQQAYRENYASVEHLKRYTTLGMGTDQGKTSNLNGLNLLAALRGEPVPHVGITTFRPPYTPVTLGAVAGRLKDAALHPTRRTVMHELHAEAGARFDFNGHWLRPQCYPRAGETSDDAIRREARAVRQKAGVTDISTLGKFEIRGTDCVEFLNRVYVNDLDRLAIGRARYALMLRDDGMVLDDGTVTRIGDDHYFITTSSGHADHVLQHLEYLLDVAWPEFDVNLVSVTEQWAGIALAGPGSRDILHALVGAADTRLESLAYMSFMAVTLTGMPSPVEARILRISYSGELAYEIYVPALSGAALWQRVTACGEPFGLVPYGMDAMDVLRIEKGFIAVGADADGRTTPYDIGFGSMVSTKKRFVGSHLLARPALREAGRLQLVGLEGASTRDRLREGAQLIADPSDRGFYRSIGHISSAGFSPTLGRYVALALVRDGRSRTGETIYAFDAARDPSGPAAVTIVAPCAYDPEGQRLRA